MPLQFEIENSFSAIAPASIRIREFLSRARAPEAAAFLADLIVEELVTNTMKYGYDDSGRHPIRLGVDYSGHTLRVEVRDDGRAFDPLSKETPDTTLPAEERDIGGLGIHLVCQMSDDVQYERRGKWNIVTATKAFPNEGRA